MAYPQRGNILFLILLAVVLFAALTYAVNSGMRGAGKDGSAEKSDALAAELAQYASLLDNSVNRLRLTNGCTDTQINFLNNTVGGYTNTNAPADKRCNLFDPAGGGVPWKSISPDALNPYFASSPWGTGVPYHYGQMNFPANASYKNIGTTGGTTDPTAVDMVVVFPFLSDAVCKAINARFGLPHPITSTAGIAKLLDGARFVGNYSSCPPGNCNYAYTLTGPAGQVISPMDFCATGAWGYNPPEATQFNGYVHVMIAR